MWTYGVDGVDDVDGVDGVDDVDGVDGVNQGDRRRCRCHAHWTLPFFVYLLRWRAGSGGSPSVSPLLYCVV